MPRLRNLRRSNQLVDDILRTHGLLARDVRLDLTTFVASPSAEMDVLLEPDCQCPRYESAGHWGQSVAFPPSRLIWVGDIVASPKPSQTPCVTVLLELLGQAHQQHADRFVRMTLPITALSCVSVAQVLSSPDARDSGMAYGTPCPAIPFFAHEWSVDFWLNHSEIHLASAQDYPWLTIATLAGYEHFMQSAECLIIDRAVKKLLIIPCWEIFSWYYAKARPVARLLFQFPRWESTTLEYLLTFYTGHAFRTSARRKRNERSVDTTHVALQLAAMGRDAAVSYARSGFAQIRATPPFLGAATLQCVGRPLTLGAYQGLFIQRILESEPKYVQQGSLRWKARPHTCPSALPSQ